MSIRIKVHQSFIHLTDNQELVEVQGNNVGDCLSHLIKQYPALRPELLDKRGKLKSFFEIYVNNDTTYPEELRYQVKDGDLVSITKFG